MLTHLSISNYALIQTLELDFGAGFSVITGETGAGKSIILGALGLLLGRRSDANAIRQGAEKCVVEAHFNLNSALTEDFFNRNDIDYDPNDCIIRREVSTNGRSRAFINDALVSVNTLRELGEMLVDIHSQHQNLLLGERDFQLDVIDTMIEDASIISSYRALWETYHSLCLRINKFEQETKFSISNLDYLKFKFNELHDAMLKDGEQEVLEQKVQAINHSEEIRSSLFEVSEKLDQEESGVINALRKATSSLQSITTLLPDAKSLADRMDVCHIEIKDILSDIQSLLFNTDYDPGEFERASLRLDLIYTLEKKYHCNSIKELLALEEETEQKLESITRSEEILADLRAQCNEVEALCASKAIELTVLRKEVAKFLEDNIKQNLVSLGIPNAQFTVEITPESLSFTGGDRATFLFSANKGVPAQPISQVASGGEISRVMLSLKAMLGHSANLVTIIFDEIDTGVSGQIALKMGRILRKMSDEGRQVISITHLPQIAALGTRHYKVYKEDSSDMTTCRAVELKEEDRTQEIARMLSGDVLTAASIENAKELMHL